MLDHRSLSHTGYRQTIYQSLAAFNASLTVAVDIDYFQKP